MKVRHLFAEWEKIGNRIAHADHIVLLTDFDGTLAPIGSRPGDVPMPAEVRRLLQRIKRSGATVAVVSGRAIEDVRRRVGLRGVWYVGAHGYSLCSPIGRTIFLSTPEERRRIRRLQVALRRRLQGVRGIEIERKSSTVAVHYRRARRRQREVARAVVLELARKMAGTKLLAGKKAWEMLPDRQINKWTAVQFISQRKRRRKGRELLFYLGDDTTDEAVFRKMKGISIVVGKRRGTAARFYLRSPEEVRQFLERWVKITG